VHEAGDTVRVIAPLSKQFARGFSGMADTFEGASRDPQALKDTIALSPATLDEGIRSLPDTRPFLSRLAGLSDEVQGTARELRASLPAVNRALAAGTPVLRRTPKFTGRLQGTLRALRDLAKSPTTDQSIAGLSSTMKALNPLLRYLGPHVTVCNYFTYMWTFLADHLSDEDATGTVERIQTKLAPLAQANSLGTIGAAKPSSTVAAALHQSDYGRAVDESGNADCEAGQRGYPTEAPFTNHRTPGNQGPTFKGRARVPAGQSYSAEPTGIAPPVLP
jgi:hypothetical protein